MARWWLSWIKPCNGCVEAAALWYEDLRRTLLKYGFIENPYDICVFNRIGKDGIQLTVVVHVDDLLNTSVRATEIQLFLQYLKSVYPELTEKEGKIIDYVGMTFDWC